MDPSLSKVLLAVLKSNPSTSNLPGQFPLLFPGQGSTSSSNSVPSSQASPPVGPAQVVNVISAGNGSLTNNSSVNDAGNQCSATDAGDVSVEIPVKIFHPSKKRDSKTYMLNLNLASIHNLQCLREEILEQLGKGVIKFDLKFDVGWFSGSHKISFTDGDDLRAELKRIRTKGKSLWCDGQRENIPPCDAVVSIDSDSDCELGPAPKKQKTNALDAKVLRINKLADELQQKHGDRCDRVQYKFWAEALDVKKHDSMEFPPDGPIWGSKKSRKLPTQSGVNEMASAFTHMANSVASAFRPCTPNEIVTPTKENKQKVSGMGISPGKKIDLQEKLLRQIDMIHQMFEKGAITSQQYEQRRDNFMAQLDQLSQQ